MFTFSFFFFNDTATTEIYTLSLHDALPIWDSQRASGRRLGCARKVHFDLRRRRGRTGARHRRHDRVDGGRSEEHTSELQSPDHLVCRLLLEKKKQDTTSTYQTTPTLTPYST